MLTMKYILGIHIHIFSLWFILSIKSNGGLSSCIELRFFNIYCDLC